MAKVRKENGKWVVDHYVGKKRKRPTFQTKAEAELFKRELKIRALDLKLGRTVIREANLKDAIFKYIELVSTKKAPRSIVNEKYYFERLYEFFGNVLVSEIKLVELEEFQSHLAKTVKPSTVNRYFNLYKHFFKKCEDWEYISVTPARRLQSLRYISPKKKLWSDEEIQKLLSEGADWYRDVLFFVAMTGVRGGEACSLTWEMVDFDRGFIEVVSIKGSGAARPRSIPLTEDLLGFLRGKFESARKLFRAKPKHHVFLNASNEALTSTHLSRETSRLCRKLGLKGLCLHGLRTTFITLAASQNLSLESIRQIAGHSNLRTTERYLNMPDQELRSTIDKIASVRQFKCR